MTPTWLRRFGYGVFRLVFGLTLKLQASGQANVPPTGPLIAACNHANFLDPFMVDQNMGRVMIFFAKVEVYETPILGWLARRYMVIPVNRGEADATALKLALRALKEGYALYVAPEGTRSKSGELLPGKSGGVVMALRTGATVAPCGIWGQKSFWSNLRRLRRTPVWLRFGPAYRFVGPAKPSKEELQAMTDEMMYRIAELMPPEWRGAYAGPPPVYRYTVGVNETEAQPIPTV
jgi:1-acyl-sn-glycerol-3-phosphate acyltransferase